MYLLLNQLIDPCLACTVIVQVKLTLCPGHRNCFAGVELSSTIGGHGGGGHWGGGGGGL